MPNSITTTDIAYATDISCNMDKEILRFSINMDEICTRLAKKGPYIDHFHKHNIFPRDPNGNEFIRHQNLVRVYRSYNEPGNRPAQFPNSITAQVKAAVENAMMCWPSFSVFSSKVMNESSAIWSFSLEQEEKRGVYEWGWDLYHRVSTKMGCMPACEPRVVAVDDEEIYRALMYWSDKERANKVRADKVFVRFREAVWRLERAEKRVDKILEELARKEGS